MVIVGKEGSTNDKADADATTAAVSTNKFPKHPSLMAWTDSLDLGFEFGEDMQKKGSALVVMPIQLHSPEPDQSIRIPSVFLPYDAVRGPENEGVSSAYNSKLGIWPKQSMGTKSTLRFQLPKCVLPFQPSKAILRVKIKAPNRLVEIKSGTIQSFVDIGGPQEAMGELTYRITDPNALVLDEKGGLHVRIAVSKLEFGNASGHQDEWEIDFIDLELEGTYSLQK